jgi:hypothetical protein
VHGVVLTADYFLVDLGTDISLPVGDQVGGFASDSGNCTVWSQSGALRFVGMSSDRLQPIGGVEGDPKTFWILAARERRCFVQYKMETANAGPLHLSTRDVQLP